MTRFPAQTWGKSGVIMEDRIVCMYIGCIVRVQALLPVQVAPSHFESCVSYFSSWRLVLALSDWPVATDVDLPNHRQSPKRT